MFKQLKLVGVDTTIKIWEFRYLVQVPDIEARTAEDIRARGVRVSGIKEYDAEITSRWRNSWCTIAEMVEYYRRNVRIMLTNPSDAKAIFDAVNTHITAWQQQLEYGINNAGAPYEDLIDLDKFACSVFDIAKYDMAAAQVHTQLMDGIQRRSGITVGTFFKPEFTKKMMGEADANGVVRVGGHAKQEQLPERESGEEYFKAKFMQNYRGGNR